jgi:hypothetical protein
VTDLFRTWKIGAPQRLEHALRQRPPQQSANQKPTNATILVAAFAPLLISAVAASLGVRTRRCAFAWPRVSGFPAIQIRELQVL